MVVGRLLGLSGELKEGEVTRAEVVQWWDEGVRNRRTWSVSGLGRGGGKTRGANQTPKGQLNRGRPGWNVYEEGGHGQDDKGVVEQRVLSMETWGSRTCTNHLYSLMA